MTENENRDESNKKKLKTCDNDGPATWSDLDHDLLLLVLMQVGVFEFQSFSGVCKPWRLVALSNKKKYMESRPPMIISIPTESHEEDYHCCIDYHRCIDNTKGKSFNSILPHSCGRTCIGLGCGHLILFGNETHDFWLLDPVTKHGLHFPDNPSLENVAPKDIKAMVVLSPSVSRLVLVISDGSTNLWFSIAGKGAWNHVSSASSIIGLHAVKGNIYTMSSASHLSELRLNPEPKLTLLETKNLPDFTKRHQFICCYCCESLSVVRFLSEDSQEQELHKLDFEEMKWVLEKSSTSEWRDAVDIGKGKFFLWKHMVYPVSV